MVSWLVNYYQEGVLLTAIYGRDNRRQRRRRAEKRTNLMRLDDDAAFVLLLQGLGQTVLDDLGHVVDVPSALGRRDRVDERHLPKKVHLNIPKNEWKIINHEQIALHQHLFRPRGCTFLFAETTIAVKHMWHQQLKPDTDEATLPELELN